MPTFAGELINAAVGVASLDDTALRGSYQVVVDVSARNAIAGSDFDKTGMRVFVQSSGELWQRTATGWTILSGKAIDSLLNPDLTEKIYISSTGDDTDNDGTIGSPYATPSRAAKKIGDGSKGYFIIIPLDDGPFEAPGIIEVTPALNEILMITFSGRLDNAEATLPGPVSATPVAGKATQYDTTSNGYTATIGDGTHWFTDHLAPFEYLNIIVGYVGVTLAGVVSPTIRCITRLGGIIAVTPSDMSVRPISTVYSTNGKWTRMAARDTQVQVRFVGLKLVDAGSSFLNTDSNVGFFACDGSGLAASTLYHSGDAFVVNCKVSQGRTPENVGEFIVGGILQAYFPSVSGYLNQATFIADGSLQGKVLVQRSAGRFTFGDVDFTGNTSTNYKIFGGGHQCIFFGDQTTTGTVSVHFRSELESYVNVDHNLGTITGTGVLVGFEFLGPAAVQGLSVAASGTLITATADVVVGNAGNFTYANLPQNDFTAVTGVGTVVIS